ncbi:hypothetical protein Drose_22790 [Dactylosporangium roseum]|uniref:PH domain-containing protein n=1 Tax=Dactylosporangium roseum TaxID=47989 RepID=A0ABY5YYY9_9ACTN|nr:hypothetical protein [Dactylosporangium roseum]UWZ34078.1 hypothetical protein Drose_22790 [Dactylosporangium roseum]
MRLVPVVDMSTSQPAYLNLAHATLIAPIHLDTRARTFRKDQQTWAVTFVVNVGGSATVYATRRSFASEQEAGAWIASVAEVV